MFGISYGRVLIVNLLIMFGNRLAVPLNLADSIVMENKMKIGDVVMWGGEDWMVIGFEEGKVQLMEVGECVSVDKGDVEVANPNYSE